MELLPGKSFNIQASSCIDALRNFETSTISMFRKLLRCPVAGCEVPEPSQNPSVAAGAMCSRIQEMEAMTDTHLEFVLCEFSKLVECVVASSGFHGRYRRSTHQVGKVLPNAANQRISLQRIPI